ncbi:WecB/TagA/CpsF family glycosyltransferase [Patescibacteria group bacterium]
MNQIYILGVKAHKIKKKEALGKVEEFLSENKFHYITTVNPEFVMQAQKDKQFMEILNDSDLAVADGIGLKFASWVLGSNVYRIAGCELANDILEIARKKEKKVYFFVWKNGLSGVEDVKSVLRDLKIEGQSIERDGSDINWEKLNSFKPNILLIGLGAPYQEKIISKMKEKTGIKLAIGVGGTFDFLTGKIKRAPKIFRLMGLEWLYRLLQPSKPPHKYFYRFKRILRAVVVFPWNVVKWKVVKSIK